MKDIVPALVAASIMIPGVLNVFVLLFITWWVRGEVDSRLSRCSVVVDIKTTFGGLGFIGDLYRVGTVACVLMFPKLFLKRRVIDIRQVAGFPNKLKRLIVVPFLLNIIFFTAMLVFRAWLYFYDFQ
ncbi:hypothetical protein [Pseudomonas sp. NFR16]|uniref:hypothetical protein n=1 Tax=Pseudomonas sp. NFR16 TaxID=1566248 RepID=UPI0008C9D28F|nr:hypothetical protein [Pseudomonas sp. NFR16]SEJ88187.1 hypothetical protein SAMN03159495_5029 [Pseudomonas sp. NFR16]